MLDVDMEEIYLQYTRTAVACLFVFFVFVFFLSKNNKNSTVDGFPVQQKRVASAFALTK